MLCRINKNILIVNIDKKKYVYLKLICESMWQIYYLFIRRFANFDLQNFSIHDLKKKKIISACRNFTGIPIWECRNKMIKIKIKNINAK